MPILSFGRVVYARLWLKILHACMRTTQTFTKPPSAYICMHADAPAYAALDFVELDHQHALLFMPWRSSCNIWGDRREGSPIIADVRQSTHTKNTHTHTHTHTHKGN